MRVKISDLVMCKCLVHRSSFFSPFLACGWAERPGSPVPCVRPSPETLAPLPQARPVPFRSGSVAPNHKPMSPWNSSILEQNVNFNIHVPREQIYAKIFPNFSAFFKEHEPPQISANEIFSHKDQYFFLILFDFIRVWNPFKFGPLWVGLPNPECMTELFGTALFAVFTFFTVFTFCSFYCAHFPTPGLLNQPGSKVTTYYIIYCKRHYNTTPDIR